MIVGINPPLVIKAKPADPFRPQVKAMGHRWNTLLDNFTSRQFPPPKASLLEDLKNCRENDSGLLWYASAGVDVTDVENLNRLSFHNGRAYVKNPPKIFIHTDQLQNMFAPRYTAGETLSFKNKWKAIIEKIPGSGESKWLIQILIDNYEFLHCALIDGIIIPYLYTACDGVTTGMGAYPKFPITTFYLTKFYLKLGVQYHITEYSREFYENNLARIIENLQKEVPGLIDCYPEIGLIKTPDFPESFIHLNELTIRFRSRTGSALVVRHCKS